ncbi:hypothetical protein GCM10029976_010050 [Kribbella albertanoniae]
MLAALLLDADYVVVDPAYPAARRQLILRDSRPRALVEPNGIQTLDAARTVDDPAYVVYTSGSTGRPKRVLVPMTALEAFCRNVAYDIKPSDRVLQFAALGFDASVEEIFVTLTRGATLVLRDDDMISRPDMFLQRCGELGIAVLDLPTAYWNELAVAVHTGAAAVPAQLRLTIIGGEPAQPEAVRRWQRAPMVDFSTLTAQQRPPSSPPLQT